MKTAQGAMDTPWKVWNEAIRWLTYPWARLIFAANGIPWGKGWHFYGAPIIQKHRQSVMRFGDGMQLRSTARSNPLGANRPVILCTWGAGARLQTGRNFRMTGGTLCAAEDIWIGDDVTIGANTIIMDTDFHPLGVEERLSRPTGGESAPIRIKEGVFVGVNCLILKGVTIGRGSVIGGGSVVTGDVPAGVIAAGNPARVIRENGGV